MSRGFFVCHIPCISLLLKRFRNSLTETGKVGKLAPAPVISFAPIIASYGRPLTSKRQELLLL
jgi:hypothetical protein